MLFRNYLKRREDTVRSIVNSLLDDSPSELADELVKGECLQLDDGSEDEEDEDWEKWTPDPVDADPSKPRNLNHTASYGFCILRSQCRDASTFDTSM